VGEAFGDLLGAAEFADVGDGEPRLLFGAVGFGSVGALDPTTGDGILFLLIINFLVTYLSILT